ncbi:MAG: ParB/RepB/Spo0J family partition protein [Oscillospiraceae bacterium]|nr:ParB/RepB/Spo0J family partition protein [Oscillospiraceae bacterium]
MKKRDDLITRKGKIIYLPLGKITPNREQPRRVFDREKLCELAASIRENGLLQPITVKRHESGYLLIAGERRLRAAHIAGLTKIPCIEIEADDAHTAALALLENLQREGLSFFEEADGIAHLMQICGITQEEVAKRLGKSQSAISNKLRLRKLGSDIIGRITETGLTERHARSLLRLEESERKSALEHIIENELNVYETDEYIDSLTEKKETQHASKRRRQQYVIRDVRLFYNTVDRAIDTMRRAGWRTDILKDEDDTCLSLNIKIFK